MSRATPRRCRIVLPYRLTCLGTPQLVGPDGDPVRFRTRKHLALLVYLAMEPAVVHRRDRLAALLWPQAELDEARHSLATALSVLRGRLGAAAIDGTRDTVRLVPGHVVTDVTAILADDVLELDAIGSAGFLDEFEIPDALDWAHWVDRERARLLPVIHRHLVRRIEHCRQTGNARAMELLAERLARLDALSEDAARAALEARALAGDRISGLRAYDAWRVRLAEELGAVPSREVDRMADRLRRHALERPRATVLAPVPTEQWRERLFVGRGAEFQACYRIWGEVVRGRARHVLLLGEDGIGKTTLAGRVATALALEGAVVARVQCHELERELPFGVMGTLVGQLLDLPGAATTAPEQLTELGRLVPKVRQRWPGLPAPSGVTGESARIQFTEAVLALLAALVAEHPVVVVCDDLHLADAASLAVLHLILRRVDESPLMAVLTMTPPTADTASESARFAEHADAIRVAVQPIGALPEVHAAELLEQLLAGAADPGPTVRRALLAGARGNPMVLELLAGDWRRRGEESLALAAGAMTRPGIAPSSAAFHSLVAGMLHALDRETRSVADLGAVLGRRLNDLRMYTLVDMPAARTMRAMTALASHRILRDAGSHLEFANEAVRGECYQLMATPLRRMLHSLVADRLLAESGGGEPIPGLEVAWHLVRGDRLGEAVPYLLAGGRESIRRGAPHEADLALSTGLPALEGAPRRTAILLLAEALQELGRWSESLRVLDLPADPFDETEECWREVLQVVGQRWGGAISPNEYAGRISRLLDIAGTAIQVEVRVKAIAASVRLLSLSRDPTGFERLREAVASVTCVAEDPYEQLHLHLAEAWLLFADSAVEESLRCLEAAVSLAQKHGFESSIAVRLLVGQANVLAVLGQYEEALAPLTTAEKLASRLDNLSLLGECAIQLAVVFGRLGDRQAQVDWARRALNATLPSDWSPGAFGARYELGVGLSMQGRYHEARSVAADLTRSVDLNQAQWTTQAKLLCAADILALSGSDKRALHTARRGLEVGGGLLLDRSHAGPYARWVAVSALSAQNPTRGLEIIENVFASTRSLHAKDRAELLIAKAALLGAQGVPAFDVWKDAMAGVAALPAGIGAVLRKFGLGESGMRQWSKHP